MRKENSTSVSAPPSYLLSEEIISCISHGIGAGLGIAALVLCIVKSVASGSSISVVASSVYGASLILLYLMSTLYHAFTLAGVKRVFRIFDHCSIFFLIAGTYTPYTLITLRGSWGWSLFGVVWGAAALGIVLNAISIRRFRIFSMICYIAMGWVILIAMFPLINALATGGLVLLFAGGVVYTVGAVLYAVGKRVRYIHSLWHIFVLAASILHFFSVYFFVL